ncbi:protein PLANT CADMIUM RESISTANCE 2-like [Quercus lobata]|uniref:Uncharacterized protein n=1 Tax=Quercus lobata TaxID=97700 RepID=A0A7N2R1A9_QUELO|nr:protein PLANT CADMIUM RESISTANCE 2-like [Quercus lobata]
MYSTNSNVYQQYSQAPNLFGQTTTTGVPVSSTGQYYETSQPAAFHVQSSTNPNSYDKYSHAPLSFDQEAASNGVPVSSTSQFYEASQPATPFLVQSKARVPWSTGLCDCFSDYKNCCLTMWCPCITFGRIAEIVDKGSSSCGAGGALYTLICCVVCCPCFYSCFYRSKMRQQYTLEKSPCGDCLVHCCCESCALCQEYRELESRGYDMKIGWHGNVERRNRGVTMASTAPVVEGGMTR